MTFRTVTLSSQFMRKCWITYVNSAKSGIFFMLGKHFFKARHSYLVLKNRDHKKRGEWTITPITWGQRMQQLRQPFARSIILLSIEWMFKLSKEILEPARRSLHVTLFTSFASTQIPTFPRILPLEKPFSV